jgi:bacterioferritin-associated ferredoxin
MPSCGWPARLPGGASRDVGPKMIVCSCNVLSDHEVRTAVSTASVRTTGQVYGCLGCSAQCGRCARTIRKIMDEALGAPSCPTGCACAAHAAKR